MDKERELKKGKEKLRREVFRSSFLASHALYGISTF